MKTAETKRVLIANENEQLYHNTGTAGGVFVKPILFNPWRLINQGVTENQRIGDEIYPRGMQMRLWMANKDDRPNILYRLIVCILPRMYNASVVASGSIDIGSTMNVGANGNYITMPIDTTKGIKVLYDKVIRNELGFSNVATTFNENKECHQFKKLWIKRKKSRKIKYARATGDIENNFLAVYLIPYDSYGTLTTDNIASCGYVATLYFKDV